MTPVRRCARRQFSESLLMRIAIALFAIGFATPTLAQDYPKLKSGLWEMERGASSPSNQPNRMTICLDDTVQREMFTMGAGAMAGMCSKHDFQFSGNRGTGDFICDFAGSRMHSKSTMVFNGNSSYRTEIHTTYDPPFMGQAETTTILTARHVGACKAGQRPGDMLLPNGQAMNIRDAMGAAKGGGAKGTVPGAARRAPERQPG
jgi:hypothetical protein